MRNMIPWRRDGSTVTVSCGNGGTAVARDPMTAWIVDTDRWFEQALRGFADGGTPVAAWPRLDVIDAGSELRIVADLPGVDEKDIELSLDGGVLTLKGEKRETKREEHETWYRSERGHGAFQRQLELPCEVDAASVQARIEQGVLTVRLPKSERAKARRIEVQKA
jgi:HSP20 family protein